MGKFLEGLGWVTEFQSKCLFPQPSLQIQVHLSNSKNKFSEDLPEVPSKSM